MTNGDGHLVCRLPFISHSPFMRGLVAFFVYLSAFYYMLDSLEIGHHYGICGNYLRQEMECIERLRNQEVYAVRMHNHRSALASVSWCCDMGKDNCHLPGALKDQVL